MSSDVGRLMKEGAMQVGAGATAGFVEICMLHPLDLVKTRFQLQSNKPLNRSDPHYYTGIVDCMKKMYRHEGLMSFWKGIIPPILVETPKNAVKFLAFEQYKKFLMFGASSPTPLTFYLAGLAAGITEAILINPFEVVKVTLQADKALAAHVPSTWAVARQIVRENGFGSRGLNKGLTATIGRNGVGNMVFLGFYHSVKGYLPEYQDPLQEFGRKLTIGFVSGTVTSCINIPFDVAKSRIQGPQPVPGVVKYSGVNSAIVLVYKEEGIRALYKGLVPKVLRLGPGGAIILLVYDYVYHYLETFAD